MNPFRALGYPIRVHAGDGALTSLRHEVDRARASRPFIVCGNSVSRSTNLLGRIREILGDRVCGVFDGTEAGSPLPAVQRGSAAAADAGADLIVSVGGGSAGERTHMYKAGHDEKIRESAAAMVHHVLRSGPRPRLRHNWQTLRLR